MTVADHYKVVYDLSNGAYPSFKVTPFFDAEYLRNGTRYRHSFNEILIGAGLTQAQLNSVISNDLTKY